MPSNFSGNLETQGAPNLYVERPRADYSENIATAGRAMTALGEMFVKDKDEKYLGKFSADLASIESGTTEYAGKMRELYLQTEGADAATIKKVEAQIRRIHAGEEQGVYNPTKAKLEIDNLVKTYSMQHPLLAKDIRTMANAAKGNLSQILNDELGLDPYVKQVVDRYSEARKKGQSPAEFEYGMRAEEQADSAIKRAQLDVTTGNVTKARVTQNASMFASAKTNTVYMDIISDLEKDFKAGIVPTADQITGYIANKEQMVRFEVEHYVQSNYGKAENGTFSFGVEDHNAIMNSTTQAFKNLTTFLTGSSMTLDQKLKILKAQNELHAEKSVGELWADNSELGQLVARAKAIGGQEFATALISGSIAVEEQLSRFGANGEDELRRAASAALVAGNVAEAAGINFALDNRTTALSGASIMNFVSGRDYRTGNTALDATTVAKGITSFSKASPQVRTGMAPGILENVSWSRLVKTPDLSSHVASDRSLHPVAIAKATSHVLSTLSESGSSMDAVTFDPLRGINAFNYKQPIGISKGRVDAILELNRTYRDVLRIFGADVASEWVNALVQPDTKHGLSKDGNFGMPKKKEGVSSKLQMGETMSHVVKANKESYGMPEEMILALGFRESSLGVNLVSPTSSAKGPLAIIDGTFNAINKKHFDGKLDPNNMYHRGEAALANLNEIYQRNGGDLTKTLLEHFSGKPDGWNVVDANGVSGVQFVTEVFQKMKEYQNG